MDPNCYKCHNGSNCYNGYNGVIMYISDIIYSKWYKGYNSTVINVIMDIFRPLI